MDFLSRCVLAGVLCVSPLAAQTDFPSNPTVGPKKYTTRQTGGGANPGAEIDSQTTENPNVRYVTHIVLYQNRWWTNSEGKLLEAKLIAFEDQVADAPKGGAEPKFSAPPAHPTVILDGKVRLLVNKKPVELPLDKLSAQDQEFIEQIKAAVAKKAGGG